MKQIFCPKCFARFYPEQRQLVCRSNGCSRKGIPFSEDEAVIEEGQQPYCAECGREITTRLCPRCGFELGSQVAGEELLGISVVGAEGVGKSHYLTVLLNSMKNEMAKVYGCALYPMGGDITLEQYDRKYFRPLFVNGQCIPSTAQEDVEPLIYSLVFAEDAKPGGAKGGGLSASLTFYDACGANFESERVMEEGNRSIYNSKGILFLIDPTQLPEIRDLRIAQGKAVCESDAFNQLARTIHLIRSGSGQNDVAKKISIPIAVCITKMDILKQSLDISSFLRYESRHMKQASFDRVDFNSCNLEVMSLLEIWGGKELVNQITSQFENCGFFAFSALGAEPSAEGRVGHITPHRVMDPMLWLLWRNGIIQ